MDENNISLEIKEIINDFNNQAFDIALEKLILKSKKYPNDYIINKLFASIYSKKKDWKNVIKYYEKTLILEKEKFKTHTNIGVAYFELGQINKSINAFKKSIKNNSHFDLAFANLGISYLEIGMYQNAINNFVCALKLNKNNFFAQSNLINIFNLIKPDNINEHPIININYKISQITDNHKIKNLNELENIKKILNESNNIIENFYGDLLLNETQIYRKNSKNLNCKRHFKVFNRFNIIPKFCFSCYKIQINLKNIVDLIKLFFIFDNLNLENNNIRKCMVEIRNNINGNYKGYIYCNGLQEAQIILKKMKLILEKKIGNFEIEIKHGCSEFYKTYPKFKKINFNGDQEIKYNEDWNKKEKIIDEEDYIRINADKKIWGKSLNGINLSDILIIKNWISYAETIGDKSYKSIFNKNIDSKFIKNILQSQLAFRIKEFKNN